MKILPVALIVVCAACGGSDDDQGTPVTLQFATTVGANAFSCSATFDDVGASHASVGFADMRYYVHNVRLVDASGHETAVKLTQDGVWQYQDVALLDFEDGTANCSNGSAQTRTTVEGTVPAGDYSGVRFNVGLPADLNHGDPATAKSPLNLTALSWGWMSGYRFLRLDMTSAGGDGFAFHLGSADCTGDPGGAVTCTRLDVPEIELTSFDPASSVITLDLAALTSETDVTTSLDSSPGCHSDEGDPDCAKLFAHIGLDFTTGDPTTLQSAFH